MGTIYKMVQYPMERFRQKQMKLDELMPPGGRDSADYFRERDTKYRTTELNVPAGVQSQTVVDATSSMPMTCIKPQETLDGIPGYLQMPHVTSRPGSTHLSLGSRTLQTHEHVLSLPAAPMPDWSQIQQSKHVEPVSVNPCISHPKLINIWKSDSDEDLVTAPGSPKE